MLRPFRALRYDPTRVPDLASVLSPPYDVIDDEQRAALERRDPYNVVRLILPSDGYEAAAGRLAQWRADGVLRADETPALYVYEEAGAGHVQRGLVGALGLARPEAAIVLPHENTMAGPVADRLALTEATAAQLEQIMLVYDGGGAAAAVVAEAGDGEPLLAAETPDGVSHRVWAVTGDERLAAVAADLQPRRAVIADGHHRYATYLRYQADRHAAGAGRGPWDFGLTYLVDAGTFGPQVHAIHRVLPTLAAPEAARRAAGGFTVDEVDGVPAALDRLAAAAGGPAFVVTDGERCWVLHSPDPAALDTALPADRSAAWRRLDVAVAHEFLVRRLLGLPDDEETVGYRHDVEAAVAAARRTGGTALLLNPTPVDAVTAVAAAGDRMPRKSTLFTPKPATGLLMRALTDG